MSFTKRATSVLYRSLPQIIQTLTEPAVFSAPEVQKVLTIAVERGIIAVETNGKYIPSTAITQSSLERESSSPFIVIEGLDGSGKTTLSKYLKETLNLVQRETPPSCFKEIPNLRDFFDGRSEDIRRAFYSLGNYIAGQEVLELTNCNGVIMDRFWHSTAAYGIANVLKDFPGSGDTDAVEQALKEYDLNWPLDLVKPNLVIFLHITESERIRRHTSRPNFTNTKEEQTLATDADFRKKIQTLYKAISGVEFREVSADGTMDDSTTNLMNCVFDKFPALKQNTTYQNQRVQ